MEGFEKFMKTIGSKLNSNLNIHIIFIYQLFF
jgi:hypothetical protein